MGNSLYSSEHQNRVYAACSLKFSNCTSSSIGHTQCADYRNPLFSAEYVRHDSIIRQRFRIANRKAMEAANLSAVFGFRPTRSCGLTCAPTALLVGHSFQAALATDPAAFSAHLPHNLLDDGKFRGLRGFQKHPASVLDSIKFLSACPLWHIHQRGTDYRSGQEGRISNRPTTAYWIPACASFVDWAGVGELAPEKSIPLRVVNTQRSV